MEDEGKKCLRGFPANRKIVSAWEKMHFLASCHALAILGRGSALVLRISPSVVVRKCPRGRKWPFKSRDCCHWKAIGARVRPPFQPDFGQGRVGAHVDHDRSEATCTYIKMSAWFGYHQSSGAVWKSRWPPWVFLPNEPDGFYGRKATLNHASALVTVCP